MSIEIEGMAPLIQVFDMPRALAFYRDILGFEVVSDSGNGDESSWIWLRLNGVDLMLNDQYEPGREPDAAACGAHKMARRHLPLFRLPQPRRRIRLFEIKRRRT